MRWCGALLALALLATQASAQFGGEPDAFPVKSDLPYIRCGVCEAVGKNAYRQVKAARDALKPGKKVSLPVQCLICGINKLSDPLSCAVVSAIASNVIFTHPNALLRMKPQSP